MVMDVCDDVLRYMGVHSTVPVTVMVILVGSMYVLVGIKVDKSEAILYFSYSEEVLSYI